MRLFRVTLEAFAKTKQEAFGGAGGLFAPGRWHLKGVLATYASEHLSLSALEALVHLKDSSQAQPYVSWEIEIPDQHIERSVKLPNNWPIEISQTQRFGTAWLQKRTAAALELPSVIVPTERNYLINPAYNAFALEWVKRGPTPFRFDQRLLKAKP